MFDARVPDMKPPQNIDPRILAVIVASVFVAAITFLGDQATFMREPRNFFENMATLLPVLGYKLTGERMYADAFAAAIYSTVFIGLALWGYQNYERKIMWPRMIRKMNAQRRMEKEIINQDGGDDLI